MTRALLLTGALMVLAFAAFPKQASAQGGGAPAAQAPPPPSVKEGQPMPDFTLSYLEPPTDPAGRPAPKTQKLSDLKGNVVVLAFFPAAFSPG
jgi:hypothetical protein